MNIFQRYLAEEFAEDYEEGRVIATGGVEADCIRDRQPDRRQFHTGGCAPPPETTETSVTSPTDSPTTAPPASSLTDD